MIIADDLSALSGHILLIAFVINPVLISLLHSKEFEFEQLQNALSTLLFTLIHLENVGLCHSGHVIPILANTPCKSKVMTRK